MRKLTRSLWLAGALLAAYAAAQVAKRPIRIEDFARWRSIVSQRLSPGGNFAAYGLFPQEGAGEFILRDLTANRDFRFPAGVRPPPPPPDPLSLNEGPAQPRGLTIRFTADDRFVVASTFPPPSGNTTPARNGLIAVDTSTGAELVRVPAVKSFQLAEDGGAQLAYLLEPEKTGDPSTLIARDLSTGVETRHDGVTEYSVSKDGRILMLAGPSGVRLAGGPEIAPAGKYAQFAWNDAQSRLAFVRSGSDARLFVWERDAASARELPTAGLRPEWRPSSTASLDFSHDGERLLFSSAPSASAEPAAKPAVQVELWHYLDDYIVPGQKVRARRERERAYRAAFVFAQNSAVQLADATMPEIAIADRGPIALGNDGRAYRRAYDYDATLADYYAVDTRTGARTLIEKKHRTNRTSSFSIAPAGDWALRFDGAHWWSYALPSGRKTNLTASLTQKFWEEDHDDPGPPAAYGLAGWTTDGRAALLYDHHDLWMIALDGSAARNLTSGAGRLEGLRLRLVNLDPDERDRRVDTAKPLLLRAEDLSTHGTGFYRLTPGSSPAKLFMEPRKFGAPVRARKADRLLLTAESTDQAPDLWTSDNSLAKLNRISDSNPHQTEYLWSKAEIVRFRNADGLPLDAVLYKPENFDPKKKYPLMVYLYEKLSQTALDYPEPRPTNVINTAHYVSNGYLVLKPDIAYTEGYPGASALKCVLPAVDAITARGYVDETAIGIQGHSWGGYQIAYMVTRTNRFRAAAPGAPVVNMLSAYNGIRWGPGRPRQFQYEKGQSRIGGDIWAQPLRYIENSPVFMLDRVKTPLLMMHNDADDAVPWYQGIEMYLALRRLGKEVYMFNYNGEPHNLRKRENQKDYTRRMQEFFGHHLKGEPKPAWMAK